MAGLCSAPIDGPLSGSRTGVGQVGARAGSKQWALCYGRGDPSRQTVPQPMRLRKRARIFLRKRSAPGAAPGALVADPGASPTAIAAMALADTPGDGLIEKRRLSAADVPALRATAGVLWVDVVGLADQDEIQSIAGQFGLHPLAVEDIINTHQRPKVDVYEGYLFVVFRMVVPDGSVEGEQVSLVVGDGYVLTFQERPGDSFEPVRSRLRHGKGRIRQLGADYLGYALIDAAIDGYFPVLETMGETIEQLEEAVVNEPTPQLVEQVHNVKRDLLVLRRAVWPLRELLSTLMRDDSELISDSTQTYLRDAYDHAIQLMDIVETFREIASGLLDVYLSSQSTRLNEVMKVLTIIATIFMPMSFIASLYGMNFDTSSPWNMPELAWRFGYFMALGMMAAIGIGFIWWFWRRGWLSAGDGR
jgi:magnesium transporter